jgi:Bacteriophage head to tail connecting protein
MATAVEGLADKIIRRAAAMRPERARHENVWRRCFDMTYPERADGLNGDQIDGQSAQNKKAEIMDSTAADATRLLASSIMSGMTPANSVWFALDAGEETDEERRWLDEVAKFLWESIHAANYDAAKFECVVDSVCAGWFALYIDENKTKGGLQFEQWPISQVYFSCSKNGGNVDTVFRCFKLTAEQAVAEYGEANVSERIAKCIEQNKHGEMFEFIHAIYPRTTYVVGSKLAKNLPFASCHVEVGGKKLARESGYHEFPVVVARWMTLPSSPYAIGPVSNALPIIESLNQLLLLEYQALGRAVAGVYVAEDDGVLNPRVVKVKGGSIIVANSVDSIKPLESGADFNVSFSKADQMRGEIRRIMMADQLQPQDGPAMTATEVHVRVALIRQLLGPLFGRFQAEDLAPTILRVFGLAMRAGVLPPIPESLSQSVLTIRYQSPLARAQKLEEVTAIERMQQNAMAQAAAGHPEAMDLIDGDAAMRLMGDGLGAPSKVLRDEKAVAALRKSRADQQAAEQQAAQSAQMQAMATDAMLQRSVKAA